MIAQANTLDVFLSDRCNMACRNCCVALNEGPAHRLAWEPLRAALDLFLDRVLAPGEKTVLFAGGEPLLYPELLLQAAGHLRLRRAAGGPPVAALVYTNGTLLTAELFGRLRDAGVQVTVSLDGGPRTNDRYRRFASPSRGSAYEAVWGRIRGLPRRGLGLNVVLRPDGLEHLLGEVRAFHEEGFKSIDLWVDYFSSWDEAGLGALARFFAGLKDYYAARTADAIPFDIPMLRHAVLNARARAGGRAWWEECGKLVLGADGAFYACEGSLAVPYGRAADQRIGEPASGVDWGKRQAYLERAGA
ncbi:radical SAM protein, partial [bacterium]